MSVDVPKIPHWAKKIKELTAQSGLSQSEIARRAGINRDAFGRYHNGVTKPPPEKLIMIARTFGLRPSDIDPDSKMLDKTEIAERPVSAQSYSISPSTTGECSNVRLSVSCDVPLSVATRVIEILHQELKNKKKSG